MNINRFMNHMDSMGRKDRFNIEIRCPQINIRSRGLRCTAVSTPGKTIATTGKNYGGATPERLYVTGVEYENKITATFMLDTTFEDKQMMELWQSYMFDEAYNLQYPDSYHGSVKIDQLGVDNIPLYSVELHEAFPSNVTGVGFSAGEPAVQTFDVEFSFRTWSSSFENSPSGLLGGLFNKKMRKIRSRLDKKVNDKLFG
mgnify:CR=1 FL=1